MDYVQLYRSHREAADGADVKVAEYRQVSEDNKWAQCRIAFEATGEGGYSQRGFAAEVGVSHWTIGNQARAWGEFGGRYAFHSVSYEEAMNAVSGDSTEQKIARSAATHIRRMTPEAKAQLVEELSEDPEVRPLLPADRKAGEAAAHEITSRIHRGFSKTELALAVDAYRQVVDALRQAVADDAVDPAVLRELDAVHEQYVIARAEAGFKVSV